MYWLGWDAHAVTHWLDPLRMDYQQAPQGVSGVWNTSVLTLGIPMTPITLLFGTTASYNVLLILTPALSCWTASTWLRRHVSTTAAALAALLYGFSPYVLAHLVPGHLHLTFLAFIPVIVMLLEDLLVRSDRPLWPTAPLLGCALAVQYFIGSEILLILALTAVPTILLLAALRRDILRARFKKVVLAGIAAVAVAVALLAYGLSEQFSNAYRIDRPIFPLDNYYASINNLFHATVALHFSAAASSTDRLNFTENGSFIGWTLLTVLVGSIVVQRKNLLVRVAAVVALIALVCELNPHIIDSSGGSFSLSPLAWVQQFVHLTGDILPVRFASIFSLACSLILAFGIQQAIGQLSIRRWVGIGSLAIVALGLLSILPGQSSPIGRVPDAPVFFTDGALQQIVPEGATVMVAPMSTVNNIDAEFWQTSSKMWFRQLGGYGLNNSGNGIPSYYPRQIFLIQQFSLGGDQQAFSGPTVPGMLVNARKELFLSGATFFIVGRTELATAGQLRLAASLLGRGPDLSQGDVWVWKLRDHCSKDINIGPLCPN